MKDITVSVTPATYDLMQGVRQFLKDARAALSDGWQPGADIPAILMAAYTDLISKISDVGQVPAEAKSIQEFIRGFVNSAEDIAFDFMQPVTSKK